MTSKISQKYNSVKLQAWSHLGAIYKGVEENVFTFACKKKKKYYILQLKRTPVKRCCFKQLYAKDV